MGICSHHTLLYIKHMKEQINILAKILHWYILLKKWLFYAFDIVSDICIHSLLFNKILLDDSER
jgi:hypothetical protein